MSKSERLGAILGTLRHYTNQAHHGQSEGGEVNYSRADAQLILTLTATFGHIPIEFELHSSHRNQITRSGRN